MAKEEEKEKPLQKKKTKSKKTVKELSHKYPQEDIKLIYDFEYDAVKETALVLARGITFYLTIMAGLSWLIFIQEVKSDSNMKLYAISVAIYISLATLVAACFIGYGILKGLGSIQRLFELNNNNLFKELRVDSFIRKGKRVVIAVLLCCVAVLVFLFIAINALYNDISFWDFLFLSYP